MSISTLDRVKKFFSLLNLPKKYDRYQKHKTVEFDPDFHLRLTATHTKKSVSCERCEGTGYRKHEEMVDYHRRDYIDRIDTCIQCKGAGRYYKHTLKLQVYDEKTEWRSLVGDEDDDGQYETHESEYILMHADYTDQFLSNRYPDLQKYKPSQYLNEIQQYRTLYELEKDRKD